MKFLRIALLLLVASPAAAADNGSQPGQRSLEELIAYFSGATVRPRAQRPMPARVEDDERSVNLGRDPRAFGLGKTSGRGFSLTPIHPQSNGRPIGNRGR